MPLAEGGKLDPNDMVSEYDSAESIKMNTVNNIRASKLKVVECKLSQLNMAMKIGWETNKYNLPYHRKQCEEVLEIAKEYKEIYNKYSSKGDIKDFELFLEGVRAKLENGLERAVEI